MPRVVDELEIDVGVVDRRVAAERVVRDVERVVRARGDRKAGLVRGVEDGRRDLADTAAEPGLQLAVDDHGRLEEALRGRALAGRAVERERLAGRDELAVDEVRDELHVVDAVRDRRRRSSRTSPTVPVMPIACAACGRALRLLLGEHERRGAVRHPAGRRENARSRSRHVERETGLRRDDAHASVGRDREVGVLRRRSTVRSRRAKYASAAGPEKRIVERSRIFASRQRGSFRRVGPAVSVTGAAMMRDAVRCAVVSDATVTLGASTRTGRPTPIRARTRRARARASRAPPAVEHAGRSSRRRS